MLRTAIHCMVLMVGWLCLLPCSLQAADFDGDSLLFARLSPQARDSTILRINANGIRKAADVETPLGSLWKLFVYAYAIDRALPMPDYVCRGGGVAREEIYCCDPGQAVTRDAALAQSCGRFFDPGRLHLDAHDWRQYWGAKLPQVQWLADLEHMKPAHKVGVSSLLQALSGIDGRVREQAESALLAVVLNGRGQSALRLLGGRYRVKTFTWAHPRRSDSVIGGAAGWTSDGSAVWFGALGSSVKVLQDYAPQLATIAEGSGGNAPSTRCVDVAMFARYPIRRISAMPDGAALVPGAPQQLRGRYRVEFANGNKTTLQANSEMRLVWDAQATPLLTARLNEYEYIARVIDREANAHDKEAARALSVVARTYLLQNASQHGECLAIADSSRTQRVSPKPASAEALETSVFTSDLILQGVNAQYRLDVSGKNMLSWRSAVVQAQAGMLFDEILQKSFPQASLASVTGDAECRHLPDAERWLQGRARLWRNALQTEPGFVAPQPQVCLLSFGNPYSDMSRQRIYVRGLSGMNSQITLAHEYLHLAFSAYPSGQDESYIELWARRLIEGESRP